MEEYQRCASDLGEPAISARERTAIIKEYEKALRKFGADFDKPYGWAVGYVGRNPNPKFSHLQEAAGRASMRIYYKLASFGIHSGAGAFHQQLGAFWREPNHSAASNGGLEQPGANTASTLLNLLGLLFDKPDNIDDLVMIQAAVKLRDETARSFFDAAHKLEREEKLKVRKAIRLANHGRSTGLERPKKKGITKLR
jgi:hypothetical protein